MSGKNVISAQAEELVSKARKLIPHLGDRAKGHSQQRKVAEDVVAQLRDIGLFRVLQPERWGGLEMDPLVFAEIQMALAEGDFSTSWIYGVLGVHPFQLALFDDRAARDVWSEDRDTLIASSYMPAGKAQPVDDGFRLSGHWKFSSGSDHCSWIMLGGMVGDPATGDYRTFLVPKADFKIHDAWHVLGLKGTGSQDIHVEEAFVPAYRVHDMKDAYGGTSPGLSVNDGWLYRLSFPLVFGRTVSNGCIGALQAMLDAFREYGAKRIGTTGSATANDADAQLICAETFVAIEEMKAALYNNYATMFEYAKRGQETPLQQRLQIKYQGAAVAERCLNLASKIFRCLGGTGMYDQFPFGRIYTDMIAARQHVSNQSQVSGRNFGATLLGLDNSDLQI